MHIPVIPQTNLPLRTRGHTVDVFHSSYDVVKNWGEPVLRSTFWRCYLPVTTGASIISSKSEWVMRPNEMIIIPPDCAVRGHAETPFTLYYAHFNCSIRLKRSAPWTLNGISTIRDQLDKAVTHESEHMFKAAVLQLVSCALASIPESDTRRPVTDERIDQAYRMMQENINSRLKNSDLARMLNMSEASLLRMFRQTVGVSPQKEHLRLRLNHAAELLRTTEESIEHIADECGFWDRNHFTRIFTTEYKTPPAQYRRSSTAL